MRTSAGGARVIALAILAVAAILAGAPAASAAGAPEVSLSARIDRNRAALGEPITLTVEARHDAPLQWEARSVADRLGPFDVRQVSGPESLTREGGGGSGQGGPVTRWTFSLAAFELGKLEIPAFPIRYAPEGGGEAVSLSTPAFSVEIVATVTDPNVEAADIRYVFALRRDWSAWLQGAAIATAVLVACIYAYRRWRRGRKAGGGIESAPAAPPRPAFDRYLEALEALLRSGLLEAGRFKEFHVEISEILKRYLGEVYAFDAVDRTTWEVMRDLASGPAGPEVRSQTGAFLAACDLVKFARHVPDLDETRVTVDRARKILHLARPSPAAAPIEAGGARAAAGEAR